ncbi:MAG: PTS fructose transporter subunit IIA [Elusimicrobia bacterium CG_4_10_14_0_8_um_filter_37_32]|nr:MAG: PTS fructose transporter subunit IIA [Elusimicrobia bacterium CG02_land_8_20_14_3_00_37_13]PIZ13127.1 MAG: PTS fructose transporter subunit IIA [Elusimicrobia bacterium CG_4_10_14_0_8_um_filter_37_32]
MEKKRNNIKMQTFDILSKKSITVDIKSRDRIGVIKELIYLLSEEKIIKDPFKVIRAILNREKKGTTGIGNGIAIPYARTNAVKEVVGAFGISKQGVEFYSLDGNPVHFIFLLLSPDNCEKQYLDVLSRITHLLKNKYFQEALMGARSAEEVLEIIDKEKDSYFKVNK